MFKRIELPAAEQSPPVRICVDGRDVQVDSGQTVATALLSGGFVPFRHTAVSGAPRAPLCLMGVCFECLLEIDGEQNVQSCLVPVREGMQIRRPCGARRVGSSA